MNLGKLKKSVGIKVELAPPACELNASGIPTHQRDDDWLIVRVSDDVVELQNERTRDVVKLGKDHIHSFTSNPQRSSDSTTHGFLKLMVQIVFQGDEVLVRLTSRPGVPAVSMEKTAVRKIRNLVVIEGGKNNVVMGSQVNITPKSSSGRIAHPPGSIGADLDHRNYIAYLITRYFEFRKLDSKYGRHVPFNHAEIHTTIQKRFKAKTYFVPMTRFDELAIYIQDRILKTIQGKRNSKAGYRSYEEFDEYRAQHGAKEEIKE